MTQPILWERTVPKFRFCDRVVMSPETFRDLKTVCSRPEAVALADGEIGKALIAHNGRTCWHAVDRTSRFGITVLRASPITVRAYRSEAA